MSNIDWDKPIEVVAVRGDRVWPGEVYSTLADGQRFVKFAGGDSYPHPGTGSLFGADGTRPEGVLRGSLWYVRNVVTAPASDGPWQPIETAPKSDIEIPPILIWQEGWATPREGEWHWFDKCWYLAGLDSEYGTPVHPTHWRPMPAPPLAPPPAPE